MRSIWLLLILACPGIASAQGFVYQKAEGICPTIINYNIKDANSIDLPKLFGSKPYHPREISEGTGGLVDCAGRLVHDEARRLEILIFAIDQMVNLKTQFLIPALDDYLAAHNEAKLRYVLRLFEMTKDRIETAVDKFVGLDFRTLSSKKDEQIVKSLRDILRKKMTYVRSAYSTIPEIELLRRQYSSVLDDLEKNRTELTEKLEKLREKK